MREHSPDVTQAKTEEFFPQKDINFLQDLSDGMSHEIENNAEAKANDELIRLTREYTDALINADDRSREKLILLYQRAIPEEGAIPEPQRHAYYNALEELQRQVDAGKIIRRPELGKG